MLCKWFTVCYKGNPMTGCMVIKKGKYFMIKWKFRIVYTFTAMRNGNKILFLILGDSPASEFYVPTFQNALSVPSS